MSSVIESPPFAVWGAAGHAKVIAELLASRSQRIAVLFENNDEVCSPWEGIPIYYKTEGLIAFMNMWGSRPLAATVAIGGAHGRDRSDIANSMVEAGMSLPSLIHPSAVVAHNAAIGDGVHVLAGSIVGVDAQLGRCAIINTGAQVDHECLVGEGAHIAPGAVVCGCVRLGAFSFVAAGAVVLPRVNIGANVIVGAGSTVTRDLPDNVIAWGSPARIIRENRS